MGTVVLLTFAFFGQVFAQQRTLRGVVKDGRSLKPIAGASIQTKDKSVNTLTDEQGAFALQIGAPTGDLQVSYVGYKPQRIPIGDRDSIAIFLVAIDIKLEVVVVTVLIANKNRLPIPPSNLKAKNLPARKEPT